MADFRPETTVYLFESTGVDAENQPYFESEGAKLAWYNSHRSFTFENYSYQRENRQYIRVQGKAGDLRKCDMLAFRNSNWKWIFCNILSIEFINPNTTEITFQTDSFQTFIEDIEWCDCWIEREMQDDDWNGTLPSFNNLQPEGIEAGKLRRYNLENPLDLIFVSPHKIVVLSSLDQDAEPNISISTTTTGGMSAMNEIVFSTSQTGELAAMLQKYAEKSVQGAIAGIYLVPDEPPDTRRDVPLFYQTAMGYDAINAKCYTSEFCHVVLSSLAGQTSTLDPEGFAGQRAMGIVMKTTFIGGSGGAFLYPNNYYGSGDTYENNKDLGVTYPYEIQIAWASSGYYEFIAQHAGSIGASLLSDVARGAVTGMFLGRPVTGVAAGAIGHALNAAGKYVDSQIQPSYGGGMSNGTILHRTETMEGFLIYLAAPTVENMKCIDEFFSRFGYRTNRCKKPNVNTRPLWNYIKTAGAVVKGPFDYSDKIAIQNAMDNGVTLWHVPAARIGDYSDMAGNKG